MSLTSSFFQLFSALLILLHLLAYCKIDGVQTDVLISGIATQNRALYTVNHWQSHFFFNSLLDFGGSESAKERIEAIDVDNKSVTFNLLEGDVLKVYKTFKSTLQVTNMDDGCLIKVTLAYEKQHEDTPPPTMYLDFVANVSKDIEAYLFKA
ncbi:kirola-like [Camellia sinensis]|uniref:kirola-like n=1 Tax=Camellia sinensis TaxID=4442 RepID=UPI00103599F1|nr:kirola-like [Camellia sinensis]